MSKPKKKVDPDKAAIQELFNDWVEAEYMGILDCCYGKGHDDACHELRSKGTQRAQKLGLDFNPEQIV